MVIINYYDPAKYQNPHTVKTSLIRTSEIQAPPSTGQPSRAILLIKTPEVGVVTSMGVTCYSTSYTFLSYRQI